MTETRGKRKGSFGKVVRREQLLEPTRIVFFFCFALPAALPVDPVWTTENVGHDQPGSRA